MNVLFCALLALWSLSTTPVDKKPVDAANSKIEWEGKKVTGKHSGTINIKQGSLDFDDNKLVGGSFTIDMSSLAVTDLQGGSADRLRTHLTSDDFFGVEQHPEATLVIKSATMNGANYDINADLTIKGITAPLQFTATVQANEAMANLVIDRTKYDVKYNSGKFFDSLGDKMIYDDFTLSVKLAF